MCDHRVGINLIKGDEETNSIISYVRASEVRLNETMRIDGQFDFCPLCGERLLEKNGYMIFLEKRK